MEARFHVGLELQNDAVETKGGADLGQGAVLRQDVGSIGVLDAVAKSIERAV